MRPTSCLVLALALGATLLSPAHLAEAADAPFTRIMDGADYLTMDNQAAAIRTDDGLIFTAGIIGMDPKTRKFVADDAAAQMQQAMTNLENTLREAGASLQDIVQFTLYVANREDYAAINRVYLERMRGHRTARTIMGFTPWAPNFRLQVQAIARARPLPPSAGASEAAGSPPSMTSPAADANALLPRPPAGWKVPRSLADIPDCRSPVLMTVLGAVSEQGFVSPPGARAGYGQALRESGLYARLGGWYVMSGRPLEVFEGDWTARDMALVAEFPCLEAARAFYWSPEYQEILKLRAGAGRFTLAVWPKRTPGMMHGRSSAAATPAAPQPPPQNR